MQRFLKHVTELDSTLNLDFDEITMKDGSKIIVSGLKLIVQDGFGQSVSEALLSLGCPSKARELVSRLDAFLNPELGDRLDPLSFAEAEEAAKLEELLQMFISRQFKRITGRPTVAQHIYRLRERIRPSVLSILTRNRLTIVRTTRLVRKLYGVPNLSIVPAQELFLYFSFNTNSVNLHLPINSTANLPYWPFEREGKLLIVLKGQAYIEQPGYPLRKFQKTELPDVRIPFWAMERDSN